MSAFNYFITRLNGTKMGKEKDRRTQNEQTITLLELDSATIITKQTTEGNWGP